MPRNSSLECAREHVNVMDRQAGRQAEPKRESVCVGESNARSITAVELRMLQPAAERASAALTG